MQPMRRPLPFALFVLCGLAADLLSKWLVFARLPVGGVYPLIPDVLHITRAENTGVAFIMLRGQTALILLAVVATIIGLVWLYWRHWRTAPALTIAALVLLLIGAIGNLVDRVCYGYVRDFIDFVPPLPLVGHWPVFNIADSCIVIGVALYLLSGLFAGKTEESKPDEAHASTRT
jgi:signal peptidase II